MVDVAAGASGKASLERNNDQVGGGVLVDEVTVWTASTMSRVCLGRLERAARKRQRSRREGFLNLTALDFEGSRKPGRSIKKTKAGTRKSKSRFAKSR